MARKFLTDINLSGNELQNAVIQPLASAPSSPSEGQIYYNTTDDTAYIYANGSWLDLGVQGGAGATNLGSSPTSTTVVVTSDTGSDATILAADDSNAGVMSAADKTKLDGIEDGADVTDATNVDAAGATMNSDTSLAGNGYFLDEDDMSSDSDTKVPSQQSVKAYTEFVGNTIVSTLLPDISSRISRNGDTMNGVLGMNNNRIATVADPLSGQDAANKNYVDNAVQGLSWKQAVRVATTTAGTLASSFENGDTIDGIVLATGDRILIKDQSTGSENGIYTVNASGAPTRALDANTSSEIDSMTVYVESGTTNADTVWSLTTDNPVLGTTALVFAQINGGSVPSASTTTQGKVELATQAETEAKTDTTRAVTPSSLATFTRTFTELIGDGVSTDIIVTHNLGNQWVTAQIFDATTNDMVECDINLTSSSTTTFTFSVAPSEDQYRVVIIG